MVFDRFVVLASKGFVHSGTFWGAVGGIAAVLAVVLAVPMLWVAWRQAYPRRRLLYGMPVVTPLLNAQGPRRGLEVRYEDTVLATPHVVEVSLVNQGRQAIPSDDFDRARPLVLDVGASIVKVLEVTPPPGQDKIAVEVDGSVLRVGPDLIPGRQKISFSLLVDGPAPVLRCLEAVLIDIDVWPGDPPDPDIFIRRATWVMAVVEAVLLLLLLLRAKW